MKRNFKQHTLKLAQASAFALCAVAAGGNSYAANDTAAATATVITPIAITKSRDLVFGKFAPGAGGSITISTSGAPTVSGVIRSTTVTPTSAKFDVTGDDTATYSITHSGTTVLTSGEDTMALAKYSDLTGAGAVSGNVTSGTLGASGQSVYVGGTLTVGAAQAAGAYTGTVIVTVEYN